MREGRKASYRHLMGGGGQSSIGQLVRRHGACQRSSLHSAGNEACVRDVVPRVRVGALHSCAVPSCSLCRHTRARRRPGAFMVRGTFQCMLVCADGSYLSNDPRGTAEPSAFPAWRSEVLTPEQAVSGSAAGGSAGIEVRTRAPGTARSTRAPRPPRPAASGGSRNRTGRPAGRNSIETVTESEDRTDRGQWDTPARSCGDCERRV